MKPVKTDYDGHFSYQGQEIFYRMQNEIKISHSRGRDMITRFIDFFNEAGNHLGPWPAYDTADEMTTITPAKALRWYEEMISNK